MKHDAKGLLILDILGDGPARVLFVVALAGCGGAGEGGFDRLNNDAATADRDDHAAADLTSPVSDASSGRDAELRDPACPSGHVGRAAAPFEWYEYWGPTSLADGDRVIYDFSILPASDLTLVGGDDDRSYTEFQSYFEAGRVDDYYPIRGAEVTYVEGAWNLVEADFRVASQDCVFRINNVTSQPHPVAEPGFAGIETFRMHVWGGTTYIDSLTVRVAHADETDDVLLEEDFEEIAPSGTGSDVPDSVDPPAGASLPEGC